MIDQKLQLVNSEIFACKYGCICPTLGCKEFMLNTRKSLYIHPSPGYFGIDYDPAEDIMFIAQNPGNPTISQEDENQYQKELALNDRMRLYGETLKSYYMTRDIVKCLDISWNHVAWTNVVKCPTLNNCQLSNKEYILCSSYLKRQLDIIRPKIVVAIGHWASYALTADNAVFGVNAQLDRYLVKMRHYSNSNLSEWLRLLTKYISDIRSMQLASKKIEAMERERCQY